MSLSNLGGTSQLLNEYLLSGSDVSIYQALNAQLTSISQTLARNAQTRQPFAENLTLSGIIDNTERLHQELQKLEGQRKSTSVDGVHNRTSIDNQNKDEDPRCQLIQLLTLNVRILRNSMAECRLAQDIVSSRLEDFAPLLSFVSGFHAMTDSDVMPLTRAIAQMLSNLITTNLPVQSLFWNKYVITRKVADKLVLRLLSSPDTATQSAAQILLINLLKCPSDPATSFQRCHDLCQHQSGLDLVQALLSVSESIILRTSEPGEGQEAEPEQGVQGLEESLGLIYTIFVVLFQHGLTSQLVQALSPIEEVSGSVFTNDQQIITSSQLTALKLIDSWLHSEQIRVSQASTLTTDTDEHPLPRITNIDKDNDLGGLEGLINVFIRLSSFAREAMAKGMANRDAPQDRRLIGVHHALLLLLQCLLSINLTADGWSRSSLSQLDSNQSTRYDLLSRSLLAKMRSNRHLVGELVDLLNQTHLYAPALSPFRFDSDKGPVGHSAASLPQGHALSSTGQAADSPQPQPSYGFDHLKRDIVRVLGSLVFSPTSTGAQHVADLPSSLGALPANLNGTGIATHPSDRALTSRQVRSVQDLVREKGGLFHVLNMTVLDERNPYMREHAIFALRYLLANNQESQGLIASLQPTQSHADIQRGGIGVSMT